EEDLGHAAAAELALDAVAAPEGHRQIDLRNLLSIVGLFYTPRAASSPALAIGAASCPPVASLLRLPPSSTITATAICGASAGAKHTNHAWGFAPSPCWAGPVLRATVTPAAL